jgi:hypothetical protein
MVILPVAVLIILGTAQKAPAQRHRGCSNATLRGDYAVLATGNVPSGQLAGPLAFVGLFTYDGRGGGLFGKLTIRLNDIANGPTTVNANYQGSYTVNANCTFQETWINLASGGFALHEATITDSGAGFVFVVTNLPNIVSGEGRRVQLADDQD